MPNFSRNCDVYQGYNYKKDKQTVFGYINTLSLNGNALTPDQNTILMDSAGDEAASATSVDKTGPVVAVLRHISWDTGTTDSLYLTGQVSTANKEAVEVLLYASLLKVSVSVDFVVWEYDPIKGSYFMCYGTSSDGTVGTAVDGVLEKSGHELNLHIDNLPAHEVQSPRNFTFSIGIKPVESKAQKLHLAVSDSAKFVKAWGIDAGSSSDGS